MSTYAIVNVADVTGDRWDDVVESVSTIRVDIDTGNTCIVKWSGTTPSWITALSVTTYTKEDLSTEMTSQAIWE